MKITPFPIFLLLIIVSMLSPPNVFPQDASQWHLPEGAVVRLGKGEMNALVYSPDGNFLAIASGIGVWVYDAQSGTELFLLTGHTAEVHAVRFSPNGHTLASGGADNTVCLWDFRKIWEAASDAQRAHRFCSQPYLQSRWKNACKRKHRQHRDSLGCRHNKKDNNA